ncbi:metal-dependent hydrolase [Candidatus Woesearchaeota archaeon]|nr:metal-dependent hydrolase [Candidatus Woesearchaeota archaeon]
MKYKTHLSFGILCYLSLLRYSLVDFSIAGLALFIVGSLLPDIDKHTSFIGHKAKIFSFSLELLFRHRGIFHSLWVVFLLWFINLELCLGYLSHLILDSINPKGVKFFWPWFTINGRVKAGGIVESLFFLVFCLLVLMLVIY